MTGVGPNDTRAIFGESPVREPLDLPPLEVVDGLAVEALPAALAHLLALQARVVARLAASTGNGNRQGDRMLSIADAAARSGMSKSWLYRHHGTLPFAKKIGRKVVFSEQGLGRWLARRR